MYHHLRAPVTATEPRLIFAFSIGILRVSEVKVNTVSSHFGRKAKRMKRAASPPITPEMAAHIKFLVKVQRLYQHQVAALVGVNQGRISEVMRGHRFPEVPPAQGSFPF